MKPMKFERVDSSTVGEATNFLPKGAGANEAGGSPGNHSVYCGPKDGRGHDIEVILTKQMVPCCTLGGRREILSDGE